MRYREYYSRTPSILRSLFRHAFLSTSRESTRGGKTAKRIRKFLEGAEKTSKEAFSDWIRVCTTSQLQSLIALKPSDANTSAGVPDFVNSYLDNSFDYEDMMDAIFRLDISGYLPEYQLSYTDRMSMANSLELRVPFLDHKVVEFACRLPARMKIRGNTAKYILKKYLAEHGWS